jgi:hypothetical protein
VADKPNILIIWGDDIGISNLSCYSDGLMGYRTPNIDRLANEGARFTDSYGEQSCTAGRAAMADQQYEIRLRGRVGDEVLDTFDRLERDVEGVETVLHGSVRDQAALHALLERIAGLGLELIAVRRLPR